MSSRRHEKTETELTAEVEAAVEKIGLTLLPNVGSSFVNGVPDRLLFTGLVQVLIEFKNPKTEVRTNQILFAKRENSRSFYRSGRLCCFTFRFPTTLGVLVGENEVYKLADVDPISNAAMFVEVVNRHSNCIASIVEAVGRMPNLSEQQQLAKALNLVPTEPRYWLGPHGKSYGLSPFLAMQTGY